MKTALAAIAALAFLAIAPMPAQAAGWTDDPAVPNCTVLGRLLGTNAPDCEWVATPAGKSLYPQGNAPCIGVCPPPKP